MPLGSITPTEDGSLVYKDIGTLLKYSREIILNAVAWSEMRDHWERNKGNGKGIKGFSKEMLKE